MTIQQFLSWGEIHHYPQLVLNAESKEVLRAGELSWLGLVRSGDIARMERAIARVQTWESRVQACQAIEVVQIEQKEEVA